MTRPARRPPPGALRHALRRRGGLPVAPLRAMASWAVVLLCAACGGGDMPSFALPERPAAAPGGAQIAEEIRDLPFAEREERIYAEVARGNVPSWFRRLRRVEIVGEINGRPAQVVFWAAPDYLSVGSDTDFFLVPLSRVTAQRVAERLGGSLPTPAMVDAVWAAADVRLIPIRIPPDPYMTTVPYFERHHQLVAAQRQLRRARPGDFVAGHKVDVVLAPGGDVERNAIYGWHGANGQPIQPLYDELQDGWVAYSHGIRLVHRGVLVNGSRRDLREAMRDAHIAPILGAAPVSRNAMGREPADAVPGPSAPRGLPRPHVQVPAAAASRSATTRPSSVASPSSA
jgi:hypothetical protein